MTTLNTLEAGRVLEILANAGLVFLTADPAQQAADWADALDGLQPPRAMESARRLAKTTPTGRRIVPADVRDMAGIIGAERYDADSRALRLVPASNPEPRRHQPRCTACGRGPGAPVHAGHDWPAVQAHRFTTDPDADWLSKPSPVALRDRKSARRSDLKRLNDLMGRVDTAIAARRRADNPLKDDPNQADLDAHLLDPWRATRPPVENTDLTAEPSLQEAA